MGRIIAIGPGGKPQAPERTDHFRPVIAAVVANKLLDQLLLSPAVKTHTEADQMRRGLYLSARYFCTCGKTMCTRKYGNVPGQNQKNPAGGCPAGGQRISCRAEVVRVTSADGKPAFAVQFQCHDKQESIRAVIEKYGPDPNQWPYFSKRKRAKE